MADLGWTEYQAGIEAMHEAMDAGYPAGAATDPARPWEAPQLDARTAREIERKTDDFAAIAFDHLHESAREWIWDERERDEVKDLIYAAIALATNPICPDRSMEHYKAVDALKEIYIRECRHLYRYDAMLAIERDVMEEE